MSNPWIKFYPSDWRADPVLRMVGLPARGLWIEMICIMSEADPYGVLLVNGRAINSKQLASLVGASPREVESSLAELEGAGVFSRDEDGAIYSRRMRRDAVKAARDKANGSNGGGNPNIRRGTVPKELRSRPFKRSDAPQKTQRIFDKSDGRCHWCDVQLTKVWSEDAANFFHVDHVIPICDGGTNDESNLVAACSDCNHKRARLSDPTSSPVSVGRNSDHKAHGRKPEARSQKPETNLRSVETADAGPAGEKMILDLIEAIGPVGARDGVLSPAGLKPIMRLLDAGCDFDADVLPAVREQCAKLAEPLRTLDAGFLRDAIHERRAARAKGAKPAAKQVFVIKDTPEWQAWSDHLARTGQPQPKAMPSSAGEGRYFPSQVPAPEALH